jgi:hypothetical protein
LRAAEAKRKTLRKICLLHGGMTPLLQSALWSESGTKYLKDNVPTNTANLLLIHIL